MRRPLWNTRRRQSGPGHVLYMNKLIFDGGVKSAGEIVAVRVSIVVSADLSI